jgi:hypothetical protein
MTKSGADTDKEPVVIGGIDQVVEEIYLKLLFDDGVEAERRLDRRLQG